MYLFTEERIKFIADAIYKACLEDGDLLSIKRIQETIDETDKAIENLWNALEQGQSVQRITERINKREAEKKELESSSTIPEGSNNHRNPRTQRISSRFHTLHLPDDNGHNQDFHSMQKPGR